MAVAATAANRPTTSTPSTTALGSKAVTSRKVANCAGTVV